MYIMGENPAMSDPDVAPRARAALAKLDCLVVQDIFLTETAYLADVDPAGLRVPGEDRHVHQHRPHGAARPAGAASRRARRARTSGSSRRSRAGWASTGTTPGRATCSTRCARRCRRSPASPGSGSRPSPPSPIPARTRAIPGNRVVFTEEFPTPTGRARFVPADIIPAAEQPDADYPMVLITGRQLEHWHTGSMTRRAAVLDAIEPEPVASMHPLDLAGLGVGARRRRSPSPRAAAASACTRAPTTARRAARCSSRSAITKPRPTC